MSALRFVAALAASALMALCGAPAMAQASIKLEKVVTGVNTPLAMVQPPGDARKFVVEQWGRVRIIDAGKLMPTPFLDIRNKIVTLLADFDERGLLGLAFHPDSTTTASSTSPTAPTPNFQADLAKMFWWDHTNVVAEYTVSKDDPNMADREYPSAIISSIDWPQFNHNGHWIGFGRDGMLYISTGDGGYANDWGIGHNVTDGNGQDLTTRTARSCASTSTAASARGQPLRQQPRRRCRRSGPMACAIRGAARSTWADGNELYLRRRAAEQLRGSQHHRARARTWAGARWRPTMLRLRGAGRPSGRAATRPA